MSAIFGILNRKNGTIADEYMKIMESRLWKYGRDKSEYRIEDSCALGCCYKKTGLEEKIEPVISIEKENTIMVVDSFLNNEVFVEKYKESQEDFYEEISREFTIALFDKNKGELTLVRDHLGVRPMYYYSDEDYFVFATDYRAILSLPFVPKEIDETSLYRGLTRRNNYDRENTYFQGIKKLPSASKLLVDEKNIKVEEYWIPGKKEEYTFNTDDEYFKKCYELASNAIEERISSDLQVGPQVSGGMDSSVIGILTNRLRKDKSEPLNVFSWSPDFETQPHMEFDERDWIEAVCNQENMICHYSKRDLGKIKEYIDMELPADGRGMSPMLTELESVKEKDIGLILSGWGGDQSISFRPRPIYYFLNRDWKTLWRELRHDAKSRKKSILRVIYSRIVRDVYLYFIKIPYLRIYRDKKDNTLDIIRADFYNQRKAKNYGRVFYLDLDRMKDFKKGYLQRRTEESAWIGAENNVEYVYPYLDKNIFDFSYSVPENLYLKKGTNRHFYRESFRKILPEILIKNQSKADSAKQVQVREFMDSSKVMKEILIYLVDKIDQRIFGKYIDIENTKKKLEGEIPFEGGYQKPFRQLHLCYNIQKILNSIKNGENNKDEFEKI